MQQRPKIDIQATTGDKVGEAIGLLLILIIWGITLYNYGSLPDIIPTHYNASGIADGFGNKWIILTLPMFATIIYIGITILNKYPHVFNYPTEITEGNALKQYTSATKLLRYLKIIVVLVFALLASQTISHAKGHTQGIGAWFLPLVICLIFIPLILFLLQSAKAAKK